MQYIYEGSSNRLVMAGRTLLRGQPMELSGAAAEAAERHPSVRRADEGPSETGPKWGSTVQSALDYVGDDRDRATEVLEAEQERGDDARKSLVSKLETMLEESDNGGGGE